ncbi:exported hypothetical protein [Gammaproteobacteria bacterium]
MKRIAWFIFILLSAPLAFANSCPSGNVLTTPSSDFVDNQDGTMTHKKTGLMWAKCSVGQNYNYGNCDGSALLMAWGDALTAAINYGVGGYQDWRLPNVKELQSLVERGCHSPAINDSVFPGTSAGEYWTSTTYTYDPQYVWHFNFGAGHSSADTRNNGYAVRFVRAGGCFDALVGSCSPNPKLTVSKTGAGSGSVKSSPAGIDCGGTCSATFNTGTKVTLSVTTDAGSKFNGWSGGSCSGAGTCEVTLNQDQTVTAEFIVAPITYLLTVNKAGTGKGSVSSNPAGISCDQSCTASSVANYSSGTTVVLSAAPSNGSTFGGWGGDCPNGVCQMDSAKTATATFNSVMYPLVVVKSGVGTGKIVSTPAGISCGKGCSAATAVFSGGTQVKLVATALTGAFGGWGGACSGKGICVVKMDDVKTVTASFRYPQTIDTITMTPKTLRVDEFATLTATTTSGLQVKFISKTPYVCQITAGNKVKGLHAKRCQVQATQAGNQDYNPAPPVIKNISVGKGNQVIGPITLTPPTMHIGDIVTASATADSGLPVTFYSLTPAVCDTSGARGATVEAFTVGTCTLSASQNGNADYNRAPRTSQDFTIEH